MNVRKAVWVSVAALPLMAFVGCGMGVSSSAATTVVSSLVVQSLLATGQVGDTYTATASVSGGTPAYTWAVSAGNLPSGIALKASTGELWGIPTAAGTTNFALTVTDSSADKHQTTQKLAITIVSPVVPLLADTGSLAKATAGSAYTADLQASGGTPGYAWTLASGSLPSGLQLSSAGVVSGIPTTAGSYTMTFAVADSGAPKQSVLLPLLLTVGAAPLKVAATFGTGSVGADYSYGPAATGGTPAYTWSIASGSLPSGLNMDATTGLVSGTPSTAGVYPFTLTVADGSTPAQTQTVAASITIAVPSDQTTWYVRPDGGTRYSTNVPTGQCDGKGDSAYPGSGVNRHCAFNDIRLLWQDGSYAYFPPASTFPAAGWVGQGGDTYIVRGSITAGTAAYRVGWSSYDGNGADPALVAAGNPAPYRGWRGNAYSGPPTPPAGTAAQHTRILGENWQSCHAQAARTPVVAGYNVGSAFNFSSSYIDFQCFDISDKSECTSNDNCTGQDFGVEGIGLANTADHLTLTDVRVHGMKTFGMLGPSGDGSVFTYLSLVGNGGGGWNADAGDGTTGVGTLLVQNYEIKWNGCGEEYPIIDQVPYKNCTDDSSGGYGDGFGTATVTSKPGWQAHFDEGEVAYNTQDGLDALHLIGAGSSMAVTRTLAYGNMGQQVKVGGAAGTLDNSVIVGNCEAMRSAIPGTPAGFNAKLSDFCRAGNQPVLMTVGHGATTSIRHNTIMGAGALLVGYVCDGSNGYCDGTALLDLEDNILLGNPNPDRGNPGANFLLVEDDTYTTPAACNAAPDKHHNWTTDGMVACNNDIFYNAGSANSHNTYTNVKDLCTDHNGTGNLCMSPGLVSEIQPVFGYPDLSLSPHGGAAYHAGMNLPAIADDYSGATFNLPPSIGALETGSSLNSYKAWQ